MSFSIFDYPWWSDPNVEASFWRARQTGKTAVFFPRCSEPSAAEVLPRWNPRCLWCATYAVSEFSSGVPRFTWDPIICLPLPRHKNGPTEKLTGREYVRRMQAYLGPPTDIDPNECMSLDNQRALHAYANR